MRRFLIPFPAVLFLMVLPAVAPVPARSASPPSRVVKAVLYPDMAEVTRVVEVVAPAETVVLTGLSANLVDDSLSAKVLEGDARIAAVSVEDVFRAEPVQEKVQVLAARIEELGDRKRLAEESIRGGRREKELLDRGIQAVFSPAEEADGKEKARPARLTPAEIESSLTLFRARAQAIDEKVADMERSVRDLDRKIAAAKQELDKIRTPHPKQEKVVRIDLAAPAGGEIAVTYLVPAAGFVPRYNVRLAPGAGGLSFELVGDAWQRTGEDWTSVVLAFSTARPGRTAQLPPLLPWEIDFRQPPVPLVHGYSEKAEMRAQRPAAGVLYDAEAAPAPAAPEPERKFASFEATLPGTRALPGNGEKKSFTLARREQKTKVAWRAVPAFVDGAFLAADGTNQSGLPVLSAPAALFLDDAFVGRGHLADIPDGADFKIDFGKDDSVRVKRKEIARVEEKGGIFTKTRRIRYRYEITAENFRKDGAPLTVRDRIPVSHNKEIVVKDVEITGGGKVATPGEGKDVVPGEVTWELSLGPGEKKVLGLSFAVESPADREIDGL